MGSNPTLSVRTAGQNTAAAEHGLRMIGKTVLVAGASGFVGRHVVARLAAGGYRVRAAARRSVSDPTLANIEWISADALDPGSLIQAAAGCDAVIHLIGIIRPTPEQGFEQAHVRATANMLHAAEKAGVRRYVQMSALGAAPQAASAYHRTKWGGEQLVRAGAPAWTIFRPSLIHGPGGEFTALLRAWSLGRAPPFLFMPFFGGGFFGQRAVTKIQPVYVGDVAEIFVRSLENDRTTGKTYAVGGPRAMSWPEMLSIASAIIRGRPRAALGIPFWVGRLLARLALPGLPFQIDQVIMAAQDNTCDVSPLLADFAPLTLASLETSMKMYQI